MTLQGDREGTQYIITNENSVYHYGEGSPVMPGDDPHTYYKWENILYQILEMLEHQDHTLDTIGVYKLVPLTSRELAMKLRDTIDSIPDSELDEMWEEIEGFPKTLFEIVEYIESYIKE